MIKWRVKKNGLIVGTVDDITTSGALRKAIEEHGPDVTIEEDVENDLVEQEGTRDVRLMRSYRTRLFFVPRDKLDTEMNKWLATVDIIIHGISVQAFYEERAPHHYFSALVTYSCPAETTTYKSISEKLLTNPNAVKEVVAMLPDEKLFLFASALKANWSMYPDRDETRRNCINGIITALATPVDPKPSDDVKRARMLIDKPFSTSDIDVLRARFVHTNIGAESPQDLPTIEEWCDQTDYLHALLAQYGIVVT